MSGVEFSGDLMKEIFFNSEEELYDRIKPALRSKKKILLKKGAKRITEQDIWDFMRNHVWLNSTGLELCDMVDDILHVDEKLVAEYFYTRSVQVKADVEDTMEFMLPKLKS